MSLGIGLTKKAKALEALWEALPGGLMAYQISWLAAQRYRHRARLRPKVNIPISPFPCTHTLVPAETCRSGFIVQMTPRLQGPA